MCISHPYFVALQLQNTPWLPLKTTKSSFLSDVWKMLPSCVQDISMYSFNIYLFIISSQNTIAKRRTCLKLVKNRIYIDKISIAFATSLIDRKLGKQKHPLYHLPFDGICLTTTMIITCIYFLLFGHISSCCCIRISIKNPFLRNKRGCHTHCFLSSIETQFFCSSR